MRQVRPTLGNALCYEALLSRRRTRVLHRFGDQLVRDVVERSVVHRVKPCVEPAVSHELLVVASLDYLAVLQHYDAISTPDRCEPVRNYDTGPTFKQARQCLLDQQLGVTVDRCSCLVKDQNLGIGDDRSGKRDQLPLTQ